MMFFGFPSHVIFSFVVNCDCATFTAVLLTCVLSALHEASSVHILPAGELSSPQQQYVAPTVTQLFGFQPPVEPAQEVIDVQSAKTEMMNERRSALIMVI